MKNNSIKIALTGCASSGKTTLFNHLKDILSVNYKVNTVEELVRPLTHELNLTLEQIIKNKKLTFIFEQMLIDKHHNEEINKSKNCDILLLDRTIYDYYIYSKMLLNNEYYNKLQKYYTKYDLIIYCEPLNFKDDGFRYNYRDCGEIEMFEQKMKPHADIILPPIKQHKRLNIIFNKLNEVL